jgi:hypothetical protein
MLWGTRDTWIKNGDKQFEEKKIHTGPMRSQLDNMHPGEPSFFPRVRLENSL